MKHKYKKGKLKRNKVSVGFNDEEIQTLAEVSDEAGLPMATYLRILFIDSLKIKEGK